MTKPRKVREPAQKRSQEKKARILEAARALIADQGYDGTNTNKIAKEAGVSVGTIYSYFQDKRDILLELIRSLRQDTFEKSSAGIDELLAQSKDLETVWEKAVWGLLASHQQDKNMHKEILIQSLKDQEIHEAYFSPDNRGDDYIKLLFEIYSDQVEVDDIDAAVMLIKFTIDDCIHHLVFDRDQPVEIERVIRQLLKMLRKYLEKN